MSPIMPPFGEFKYIYVIIDTHSSFVYALAQTGEKVTQAIKALKTAMLVMDKPWVIKIDNDPAYASQTFKDFLQSSKIKYSTGIP